MITIENGKMQPTCPHCRSEIIHELNCGKYVCARCFRQFVETTVFLPIPAEPIECLAVFSLGTSALEKSLLLTRDFAARCLGRARRIIISSDTAHILEERVNYRCIQVVGDDKTLFGLPVRVDDSLAPGEIRLFGRL